MSALRKEEERILSPEFLDEIKRVRESRGISIEEVAERTNIKTSYIKAIEDGELSRLPGGVYNKAYIKSVSEFLGINTKQYERSIEADNDVKEKQVKIELGQPLNASMPSKVVIVGCLFVIFVLYSVFYGPRSSKNEEIENVVEEYKEKQTEKAEIQIAAAKTEEEKQVIQAQLQQKTQNNTEVLNKIPAVSPVQKATENIVAKDIVLTIIAVQPAAVQVRDYYGKVVLNKQMGPSEAVMLDASKEYYLYTNGVNNIGVYIDGILVKDMAKIERAGQAFKFNAKSMVATATAQPITVANQTAANTGQAQAAAIAPAAAKTTEQQKPAATPAAPAQATQPQQQPAKPAAN